jgi:fructose-bisphosphate aldolase class I
MDIDAMARRLGDQAGFIAALDQSGGSTPRALAAYGIGPQRWGSGEEMFALIHALRCRILLSPAFDARRILAVILFARTLDGDAGGHSVPELLKAKGIVPFLKIDEGLESERAGVQLMRPIEHLGATLDQARARGVFGTKARSLIHTADASGIADVVAQQFELARAVLAAGMVPVVEPEVALDASHRAEAEAILRGELLHALDGLGERQSVILKLTLPVVADIYRPLAEHPRVLRMAALSGGYSRSRACAELARNHNMIASFSRALLEGLHETMDDAAFDAALGRAVEEIYQASTVKSEPPRGSGTA